jgi:hypothetical protein
MWCCTQASVQSVLPRPVLSSEPEDPKCEKETKDDTGKKETPKEVGETLKEVGEIDKVDAATVLDPSSFTVQLPLPVEPQVTVRMSKLPPLPRSPRRLCERTTIPPLTRQGALEGTRKCLLAL